MFVNKQIVGSWIGRWNNVSWKIQICFSVKLEFDKKLIFPMQRLFLEDSNLFIAYNKSIFSEAFKCCCCDNGVLPGL